MCIKWNNVGDKKKKMSRKKKGDWPYPPNYNHLLGYVEKGVVNERKKSKGPVCFDRNIKDGRALNK